LNPLLASDRIGVYLRSDVIGGGGPGESLILSSDSLGKEEYPALSSLRKGLALLDVLRGAVVWFGRYVGTGKTVARKAGVPLWPARGTIGRRCG
jgi:hypothetical protein